MLGRFVETVKAAAVAAGHVVGLVAGVDRPTAEVPED